MSNPVQRERFSGQGKAKCLLPALFFLIFIPGSVFAQTAWGRAPDYSQTLVIELDDERTLTLRVEVAADSDARRQGLMFRQALPEDAGMLFDYGHEQTVHMWMKNTHVPLDMLFIDSGGRIVRIVKNTRPGSLEIIDSGEPVQAVLEINAGTAARYGIQTGDHVRHAIFADE